MNDNERFAAMDRRDMAALYPPAFDARDETEKLRDRVQQLEELVADLTKRVESIEQDRDSEETLRMERLERGYDD